MPNFPRPGSGPPGPPLPVPRPARLPSASPLAYAPPPAAQIPTAQFPAAIPLGAQAGGAAGALAADEVTIKANSVNLPDNVGRMLAAVLKVGGGTGTSGTAESSPSSKLLTAMATATKASAEGFGLVADVLKDSLRENQKTQLNSEKNVRHLAFIGMVLASARLATAPVAALAPGAVVGLNYAFRTLIATIGEALLPAFQAVTAFFYQLANTFGPFLRFIGPVLGAALESLGAVIVGVIGGLVNFLSALLGTKDLKDAQDKMVRGFHEIAKWTLYLVGALVAAFGGMAIVTGMVKALEDAAKGSTEGASAPAPTSVRTTDLAGISQHIAENSFLAGGGRKTDNQWLQEIADQMKTIKAGTMESLIEKGVKLFWDDTFLAWANTFFPGHRPPAAPDPRLPRGLDPAINQGMV